jgi:1,4-dihydroxy-2-naphthoate octaprenyltransferase
MFKKVMAFFQLSRPVFLLGGIVLYALGALVARYEGYTLDPSAYLMGQLFVTSLQLMTHYLNDYWDIEADHLNTSRTLFSGGSGVLPEGKHGLTRETAFIAAIACLAINSAAAIMLIFHYQTSPAVWAVLLLGFLGSFFYSSPPLRFSSSGYGEIIASITVAGLVPALGQLLQTGHPSRMLVLATTPLIIFHYAMLIAFEFPDFLTDEAAGKKTLLVRVGRRAGASIHNGLIALALGLAAAASFIGLPAQVALSVAITAPLAVWQIMTVRRMRRGEPISFHRLTFGAVALFALTAYLMAFSFWVIG